MNKTAIKNFAVWARNKLIADISYRAGLMGITESGIASALPQSTGTTEFYDIGTAEPYAISGEEVRQRERLVELIRQKEKETDYITAYEYVVEEVAYTWFNRLIAIRFMEVNDYLPSHLRVLSSETGKIEPDLVTMPFDSELKFSIKEEGLILQLKQENKIDELFRLLFIKQCNALNDILPVLFERTSDYTELLLNLSVIDHDGVVYHLVHDIEENEFNVTKEGQIEIIGWLYQYYNAEPKDKAFALLKKNIKFTKERVPAVTQLFTPDWIVRYLVENTLGHLWLEGHDDEELKEQWTYYLETPKQSPSDGEKLKEASSEYRNINPESIKIIDPCMGSGHILVYCFDVLMQIYEAQGYTSRDAVREILENNLYGLDIDKRAAQLAYFSVMMKARQYDRRIWSRGIVPHIHEIKESNDINRYQLKYFGNSLEDYERNKAIKDIKDLLDLLEDAKEYGSILNVKNYDWKLLFRFLNDFNTEGQMSFETIGLDIMQEQLASLVEICKIQSQKYDIVITNPPYMGSGGMNEKLLSFVKDNYPDSKADMFSVFIEKCGIFAKQNGFYALITQPSVIVLSSFAKLRKKIQDTACIESILYMGRGIFGIDFGSAAMCFRKTIVPNFKGNYFKLFDRTFQYIAPEDIKELFFNSKKDMNYRFNFASLKSSENEEAIDDERVSTMMLKLHYHKNQNVFNKIDNNPWAFWLSDTAMAAFDNNIKMSRIIQPKIGMVTGDTNRFIRYWYEVDYKKIGFGFEDEEEASKSIYKWFPYQKGGNYRKWYGNLDYVVNWENGGDEIKNKNFLNGRVRSHNYNGKSAFKSAITWSSISSGPFAARYSPSGFLYDVAGPCCNVLPENCKLALAFILSKVAKAYMDAINPTINFVPGTLLSIPYFDEKLYPNQVSRIIELSDECIEIEKQEWNSYENSWEFEKHPLMLFKETSVKKACEKWIKKCEEWSSVVKENEEEINSILIDIYGMQEEINSDVEQDKISIRKPTIKECMISLISYAIGCVFGRYSDSTKGVVFAGGDYDCSLYSGFVPDVDGIVPITDEEYFEDDIVGLFCQWLKNVFGEEHYETNLEYIAKNLEVKGNSSRDVLRNYFIKEFFKNHCKDYQKRPIYWLFESGKQNGFKALVYMHRYDANTVGNLRVDYLHRMQRVYESEINRMTDIIDHSANAREVVVATKRKEKLQKQLKECREYDEKIGHLALSRIDIDLDDGVKANYEKVQTASDGKKYQVLAKI